MIFFKSGENSPFLRGDSQAIDHAHMAAIFLWCYAQGGKLESCPFVILLVFQAASRINVGTKDNGNLEGHLAVFVGLRKYSKNPLPTIKTTDNVSIQPFPTVW